MTRRRTPKRKGRPPKPASQRQSARVLVALLPAERKALERAARADRLTLSALVRRLVLAHLAKRGRRS